MKPLIYLLLIFFSTSFTDQTPDTLKISSQQSSQVKNLTGVYYVDINKGNDANPGQIDKPFKSIEKAYYSAIAGNTIFVRGGIYEPRNPNGLFGLKLQNRNGMPDKMIKIWAYENEKVIFDLSKMKATNDNPQGITINASYIHLKGFEIRNMPQMTDASGMGTQPVAMVIYGNYNLIENCTVHDIGGIGINIGGVAINTVIKNCDVYNCYDPKSFNGNGEPYPGGHADGFHATYKGLTSSVTFIGCRSWNNSDDGYDVYNTDGPVFFQNCYAIRNGYVPGKNTPAGDGSGFKLGRTTTTYPDVRRTVTNCVAALNREQGFTQNGATCGINVFNNTGYKNGLHQFDFGNTSMYSDKVTLQNNLAGGVPTNYTPIGKRNHNSWDSKVTVNDKDFKSVDINLLLGPRKPDGSLPDVPTLRLAPGSDLAGAAIDLGFGKNIGAF